MKYYTVVAGDSLWAIAMKHGLSIDELCKLNGIQTNSVIHPGDRLIISKSENATLPDNNTLDYHTVISGDSLWSIAHKYGLTIEQLCTLNSITSSTVIHPGDKLLIKKNSAGTGPTQPTPPLQPIDTSLSKVVEWFRSRIGKVGYSQDHNLRQGPYYYDCSSAVYAALIYAGYLPEGTWKGNTTSLYGLIGTVFYQINKAEVKFGDIFLSNEHTGVFTSPTKIVHCIDDNHGMGETDFEGWVGSGPFTYLRLKNISTNNPAPIETNMNEVLISSSNATGMFTATRQLPIYNNYSESSARATTLEVNESVYYDSIYTTNKNVYISYVSFTGVRRYIPIQTNINGIKGPLYGTLS